ncbi:hypothetical protein GIB67_016282 [Kingdonia uniflora]|uniref:Diacylglycerol O-acyltransferase n=1 Tax=Kingdonia uniflora TaxID=39325 RepID=A0A7J7M9L2_9MAGN|nr:hypothetical protein GIB67_016282 [Kingdonia uniflora]
MEKTAEDVPVTPAGRMFLHPDMDNVISCAIGLQNPIDIEALKSDIKNSIMIQHPRFRSLFVKDKHGREHWRLTTRVNLENHVFVRDIKGNDDDDEDIVNEYLADLAVSSPLAFDKPLWEVHILRKQKCFVLRVHHALGDGISLMSLFLACCTKVDQTNTVARDKSSFTSSSTEKSIPGIAKKAWRLVMVVVFTFIYVLKFIGRSLGVKDGKSVITGGDGVELWPRKLATAKFNLEDMKKVKSAITGGTVNDVLFGVISSGLARYLEVRLPNETQEGLQITGLAMVNLRKQPGLQEMSNLMKNGSVSRWGNQFGFFLLPIYHHKDVGDPLSYVKRAKAMLDRKKLSLEAHFSYSIGKLVMSLFGPKVATLLNRKVICNTSFTISNILGPQEEIMISGNPMVYIRVNTSSLSHAITMHMVSYTGKAEMQILVAKDIIPDPKFLAKCFEDALLQMRDAATTAPQIH